MKSKTKMLKEAKSKGKDKHISFILDETGSMMDIKDKTIKDFNEYLQAIRKEKGIFTLTKFNSNKVEVVYTKPIKDVPELTAETYKPDATTPLYDAIGKTVKALEVDEGKQELLIVILTDGEENASKEYDKKAITALMKEKEAKGWTFVYLGVGQAAWAEGQKMGMQNILYASSASRAMNVSSGATTAFFRSGSSGVKSFMSKNRK